MIHRRQDALFYVLDHVGRTAANLDEEDLGRGLRRLPTSWKSSDPITGGGPGNTLSFPSANRRADSARGAASSLLITGYELPFITYSGILSLGTSAAIATASVMQLDATRSTARELSGCTSIS